MAGILYVVATPIGNLEDVTLRALRVLREVSLIAAEDTRRTARLLQHYSISTRTTSLHAHNEHEKARQLVDRLKAGDSIALVSDAGTPLVSDPGHGLVALARAEMIRIEAIPGPSAVMAALSLSGWGTEGFLFLGFPPIRASDREAWLVRIRDIGYLTILFEAPHRLSKTLAELARVFGEDHLIGVGRELTKTHEELVIQPIRDLIGYFADPRGEFTLLIPPAAVSSSPPELPGVTELVAELGQIANKVTGGRRQALRIMADRYGLPVNELYRLLSNEDPDGSQKP